MNSPEDKPLILIKYGGNAMLNERLKRQVVHNIYKLYKEGFHLVLVHGGGPFIKRMLKLAQLESEFIDGHRKTTPEALEYIEMALKGQVNGSLVNLLGKEGIKGVGLSGKDGRMVIAKKRYHIRKENGVEQRVDLGMVGDVIDIDTTLLKTLLQKGYVPVITCLASDEEGNDYNINADMFAGALAGALKASNYLILTDVDGLFRDIDDPSSIIKNISLDQLPSLFDTVIKGGMIPKMESCRLALEGGAQTASIINGTKPETIREVVNTEKSIGTKICL